MKYKTVHYEACINLGNYNNEKIGFTVDIGEEETPEQVIEVLREKTKEIGGTNVHRMYEEQRDRTTKLIELNSKLQKATEQWNATAEFLRAQGIKPDAPDMPQFINLLPEVQEEHVVEGEYDEDEAGDDDEAEDEDDDPY